MEIGQPRLKIQNIYTYNPYNWQKTSVKLKKHTCNIASMDWYSWYRGKKELTADP